MQHKFQQYSRKCLALLDQMGGEVTEDISPVHFPEDLYKLAKKSEPERLTWFVAQVLQEVSELMDGALEEVEEEEEESKEEESKEEGEEVLQWEEKEVKDFMSTLDTQLEGTLSCVHSKNKKSRRLHLYFKKLRNETVEKMEDKVKAWELVRKEVRNHLRRVNHLASIHI
ncbi:interferon phi 4 [Engraulis encrasicolus]|uniref:interferon phi 4 n=1 Tax=Engraulis encrasicolus TaxID=184585 RepID=UPI002FD5E99B